MKYLTELITREESNKWKRGDDIFITAPTGSGKTYFIKERFENTKHKVLLMANRKILRQQMSLDFRGTNIHTINYQELETYVDLEEFLNQYDVVVLDELHYLAIDSLFNRNTDIILKKFQFPSKRHISIYMTATPEPLFEIRNRFKYQYSFGKQRNNIKDLHFFYTKRMIEVILDQIPQHEKCIVFGKNADELYSLHCKYEDSAFLCSEANQLYRKSSMSERANIIKDNKFNCRFLFTTQVLDNGVNIVDESVKHIIIDMMNPVSIVQSIGRKRMLQDNDKVNVYLRDFNKFSLSKKSMSMYNPVKCANCLLIEGKEEFLKKYNRSNTYGIINHDLTVNFSQYYSYKYFQNLYYNLQSNEVEETFQSYITNLIGCEVSKTIIAEKKMKKISVEPLLIEYLNKPLFDKDKNVFAERFFERVLFNKNSIYRQQGIGSINGELEDLKLEYKVKSIRCTKKINHGKWYWMVIKDE